MFNPAMTFKDYGGVSGYPRNEYWVKPYNAKWLGKTEVAHEYTEPPAKTGVNAEGHGSHGVSLTEAPWAHQVYDIPQEWDHWTEVLGMDENSRPDLGMDVALFYLLQGIIHGAAHRGMQIALQHRDRDVIRARRFFMRQFNALSKSLALPLRNYALGAIGGELRHHKAIGGVELSMHRKSAWSGFAMIADQIGVTTALEGAITVFNDFKDGSSYGGKKWAVCTEALLQYERGAYSDVAWIDRVINLQHNTGSFLNKVNWPSRGSDTDSSLDTLTNKVIVEHAKDVPWWGNFEDWAQVDILGSWFDVVNRALVRIGQDGHIQGNPYSAKPMKTTKLDAYTARHNARQDFIKYRYIMLEQVVLDDPTPHNLAALDYAKSSMTNSGDLQWHLSMPDEAPASEACRRHKIGLFTPRESMMICPGKEHWEFGTGPYDHTSLSGWDTDFVPFQAHVNHLIRGQHIGNKQWIANPAHTSWNSYEWDHLTQAEWFLLLNFMDASQTYLRGWGNSHGNGYMLSPKKPKKNLKPYIPPKETWSVEAQVAVGGIWTELLQEDPEFT